VARQVKAERGLFLGQLLAVGPGRGLHVLGRGHQVGIVTAEQADLVGRGRGLAGRFHREADRRQQDRAVDAEAIHGAGADQGFDGAAVDLLAVHAQAEVEQVLEPAAALRAAMIASIAPWPAPFTPPRP
jgi:hypothetical protein